MSKLFNDDDSMKKASVIVMGLVALAGILTVGGFLFMKDRKVTDKTHGNVQPSNKSDAKGQNANPSKKQNEQVFILPSASKTKSKVEKPLTFVERLRRLPLIYFIAPIVALTVLISAYFVLVNLVWAPDNSVLPDEEAPVIPEKPIYEEDEGNGSFWFYLLIAGAIVFLVGGSYGLYRRYNPKTTPTAPTGGPNTLPTGTLNAGGNAAAKTSSTGGAGGDNGGTPEPKSPVFPSTPSPPVIPETKEGEKTPSEEGSSEEEEEEPSEKDADKKDQATAEKDADKKDQATATPTIQTPPEEPVGAKTPPPSSPLPSPTTTPPASPRRENTPPEDPEPDTKTVKDTEGVVDGGTPVPESVQTPENIKDDEKEDSAESSVEPSEEEKEEEVEDADEDADDDSEDFVDAKDTFDEKP